jgi:hypothetical protein
MKVAKDYVTIRSYHTIDMEYVAYAISDYWRMRKLKEVIVSTTVLLL